VCTRILKGLLPPRCTLSHDNTVTRSVWPVQLTECAKEKRQSLISSLSSHGMIIGQGASGVEIAVSMYR
jgi:hypothetical protein